MSDESGVRRIVEEAVTRLRGRRAQVQPIAERAMGEVNDADRFSKMFERALGPAPRRAPAPAAGSTGTRPASSSPRGAFTAKTVALLVDGGRTAEAIVVPDASDT